MFHNHTSILYFTLFHRETHYRFDGLSSFDYLEHVCVCVCVCVCVYVCVCMHGFDCVDLCVHVYGLMDCPRFTRACVCVCVHGFDYVDLCTCVWFN